MDFSFSPITVTRFDEACVTSLETCFFGFFFSISMRGNSQTIYTVRNNHTSKRDKVESFWLSMSDHKICCLHYNCRFHFFKFLRTSFFEQEWPVMWIVDCTSICYACKKNMLGSRQPNHFTPVQCITQLIRHDVIAAGIEKTQQQPEWPDTSAQLYVYS